ncbi:hypothetical protein KL921_002723 [Ogataea angusta]|uniref:Uncharacterized protein n=1 Tax=Pichia angusta TaxID=870730 RepID=A0AAN6DIE7_PICAN|nr:uncharacterized protein KL928_001565 [Ogataea angusta]KAG7811095.1 hypothetical protein KL921_002723 [Ogataea angusta]KAG7820128.1 hypothetical protein KL928_001565 [Ogataea angusta]KAG7823810.1 hypothetical protein KL909_002547 [Ogataea angusta]KAG7838363.1 hypothetical protein KL943_000439 [Ogataea angusta]KAG7860664.1 hypothetical protein KL939_001231 [Ogataea angusta]
MVRSTTPQVPAWGLQQHHVHGKRSCVFQRVCGVDLGQVLCRCEDRGQDTTEIGEGYCLFEISVEEEEVGGKGSVECHVHEKYAVRLGDFLLVRARKVYRGSCEVRAKDQDERVANGLGGDLDEAKLGVDALEPAELVQTASARGRAD